LPDPFAPPPFNLAPLRAFQGQRIIQIIPEPDGGFPVLIGERGDALILIDWRQGKAGWEPTAKASQLYDGKEAPDHP